MNNSKIIVTSFLVLYCFVLHAQIDPDQFTPGLNFEEEARAYKKLPRIATDFGAKADDLPFSVSLKELCPAPGVQGEIGSCVGWAAGYGAMTILYADKMNWEKTKITEEAFSAMFIFNQIQNSGCYGGATLAEAGDFMKEKGNCKSKAFDYPNENCNRKPEGHLKDDAKRFKIKDYYALFSADEKASKKIYLTKRSLANRTPVVMGMQMRKNFAHLTKDSLYWNPDTGDTRLWGGHAMVVVGFDDKKEAFLLLNSWGADWGDQGFVWIKYDDFKTYCMFAYQYVLEDKIPTKEEVTQVENTAIKEVVLKGNFNFRYPDFANSTEEEIAFEYAKPNYTSGYFYEMSKKDWEVGDQFQLVVNEMAKGHYIYVFSVDGEGANVHWPRGIQLEVNNLDKEVLSSGESPIIPFDKVEIIIPGEKRVLVKRTEGTDHICILYCAKPIEGFEERILRVANSEGLFKNRFKNGFGDLLIGADQIKYKKSKMGFYSKTKTSASIVPIVLGIEGE